MGFRAQGLAFIVNFKLQSQFRVPVEPETGLRVLGFRIHFRDLGLRV